MEPLSTRLADVQRGTDGAYRGNTISRQVTREHLDSKLAKRIGHAAIVIRTRPIRRCLRAADDHHHQLVGADERYRRPSAHGGADEAATEAVGEIGRKRRDDAQAEELPRQPGPPHVTPGRVQHTIELA